MLLVCRDVEVEWVMGEDVGVAWLEAQDIFESHILGSFGEGDRLNMSMPTIPDMPMGKPSPLFSFVTHVRT